MKQIHLILNDNVSPDELRVKVNVNLLNNYKLQSDLHIERIEQKNALILGETYHFGGFDWICAEKLDKDVYAMQIMETMTTGYWPGYVLSHDYNNIVII